MSVRVLRWQLPVDDEDHELPVTGEIVACAGTRGLWSNMPKHWVEFWAVGPAEPPAPPRVFRVFGTGQPIPAEYVWRGTAPRTDEGLVWHLLERLSGAVTVDVEGLDLASEALRGE